MCRRLDDLNDALYDFTPSDSENWRIELDPEECSRLTNIFETGQAFDDSFTYFLRPYHWLDDLPYEIHTGRELDLMLAGKKPMSYFYQAVLPDYSDAFEEEAVFDTYVTRRIFIKREHRKPLDRRIDDGFLRQVFFALPGEEWRVDAFLLMDSVAASMGWSDSFERYSGALLGYSEPEAQAYFEALNSDIKRRIWKQIDMPAIFDAGAHPRQPKGFDDVG